MLKKIVIPILLLSFVPPVYGATSANVKVENNVSSSSNSQISSHTNIRVETNGHVTTYSSDKPETIEVKAEDDTSEIKVNGVPVDMPTSSPTAKPTPNHNQVKAANQNGENFFKTFERLFKKFFFFLR